MENIKSIHDANWRNNFNNERNAYNNLIQDLDSLDIKCLDGILSILKMKNWSFEDIADLLSEIDLLIRLELHVYALNNGEYSIAQKIKAANRIIKERRINAFKNAVANNTQDEVLNNMPLEDKMTLKIDMGLFKYGDSSLIKLTDEEQKYLDIIDRSIIRDIERIAKNNGFNNLDEWKQSNPDVSKYMQLIMQKTIQ